MKLLGLSSNVNECKPLLMGSVSANFVVVVPGVMYIFEDDLAAGAYTRPLPQLKTSIGSGIEGMVSTHVRPIRTVHDENSTDRLAESLTRSPSLSQ